MISPYYIRCEELARSDICVANGNTRIRAHETTEVPGAVEPGKPYVSMNNACTGDK
jgi:hypothetical protein